MFSAADAEVEAVKVAPEGEANIILLSIIIFPFSQTIFSCGQFVSCKLNF